MKRVWGLLHLLGAITLGFSQSETKSLVLQEYTPSEKLPLIKTTGIKDYKTNKWIEVKKYQNDYIIYDPCDGDTSFIDYTEPQQILFHWQIEEEEKRPYSKLKSKKLKNGIQLNFSHNNTQVLELKIKPYNLSKQIFLLEFEDQKMLVIPYQNIKYFKQIENKCPNHKDSELDFQPI